MSLTHILPSSRFRRHPGRTPGVHSPHRQPARPECSDRAEAPDLRPQFRLRPGQDDLLIEWLTSFAPRERSEAIREALRAYLAVPQRASRGPGEENAELAAALDALF